jgi:hypothetical protein
MIVKDVECYSNEMCVYVRMSALILNDYYTDSIINDDSCSNYLVIGTSMFSNNKYTTSTVFIRISNATSFVVKETCHFDY